MRTELELYDIIKPYSNANAEGGSDIGTYDAITCLMEVQKQARTEAFREVSDIFQAISDQISDNLSFYPSIAKWCLETLTKAIPDFNPKEEQT
jgi:hypothetical protein